VSPEARAICLRIRGDADRFLRQALLRISLLGRQRHRTKLLDEYIAGRLGTGW
jgi:hypothetical protein